jgi:hypothetical protein
VPIDQTSTGAVSVLSEVGGVATLYIDATAGGFTQAAANPWVYVDLEARARVDVSDVGADASVAWDLALKRTLLRTNSGDGGYAGQGGAKHLDEAFELVTSADAAQSFEQEDWFDEDCELELDASGAISTSFDGWYLYENMTVSPAPGTWLVRSGDGARVHKIEILDYYATPDGGSGATSARYRVRVADITP